MARICGICPVSHLIASAKAVDDILAVEPPPTGADLRRIINLGQIVQSNALSFFHLSSPDLLFGFDADPAVRNILGVARENPSSRGTASRSASGASRSSSGWAASGSTPRGSSRAAWPRRSLPRSATGSSPASPRRSRRSSAPSPGTRPTCCAGRTRPPRSATSARRSWASSTATATWTTTAAGSGSSTQTASSSPTASTRKLFNDYIGEAVEPWSFLKSTYWKAMGYPDGIYRVGPLARLNVADRMGTPRADEELEKFRWRVGRVAGSSFHYHYARLIDTLHAIEKIEELLRGPDILSKHVRSRRGHQPQRGHRRLRGAPRHAHAPLQGGRRRHRRSGRT